MGWGEGEMRGRSSGAGRGNGHPPVVIAKAWPPVGRPQQRLYRTGQVHKHVAHQKEPRTQKGPRRDRDARGDRVRGTGRDRKGRKKLRRWPSHVLGLRKRFKGHIPLQRALVRVGVNLRTTKDRFLRQWGCYNFDKSNLFFHYGLYSLS